MIGEKISIITISLNSVSVIEKTMKSVLRQTYRPLEHIIVDGLSNDGTVDVIQSLLPLFEKAGIEVKFKSEKDHGISDAFNKGIYWASGSIIGITNADDEILAGTLDVVAKEFAQDLDVLYGNCLWVDTGKGTKWIRRSSVDLSDLKITLRILHPAAYVRARSYEQFGGFKTEYKICMDKDLLARIQRMGGKFKYIDKTLVKVTAGGASDQSLERGMQESEKIAVENGVPLEVIRHLNRKGYRKQKIKRFLKKIPGVPRLVERSKRKYSDEQIRRACQEKPYLYDLYRWTGKTDIISLLKWRHISKYKIVYLFRKCQQHKQNKIRFLFYRLLLHHYSILYGVDIGTRTIVGPGFRVSHIGAIAINPNVVIGKDVEIMQGVTIGGERRGKREGFPTIGNKVWIGSNAVIVGNIHVGNNVLIAAGAFVNFDIPDNSIVLGNPGRVIHNDYATEGYITNTLDF